MDPTTAIVATTAAQLVAGGVIASAIALGIAVVVDAHRAGMRRVRRATTLDRSTEDLRTYSRLDELDGLTTRRDA